MATKKDNEIELIIKGEDEYSSVSDDVRDGLKKLSEDTKSLRKEFVELDRAIDLSEAYKKQEVALNDLISAQAKVRVELEAAKEANKEAKGQNIDVAESLARLTAENKSLTAATTKAQKEFDATKNAIKKYGVSIDDVGQNQDKYKNRLDEISVELADVTAEQGKLVNSARDTIEANEAQARSLQELEKNAEKYKEALSELVDKYVDGEISINDFNDADEELIDSLSLTADKITDVKDELRAYSDLMDDARYSKDDLKQSIEEFTEFVKREQRAVDDGISSYDEYEEAIQDAAAKHGIAADKIDEVIRALDEEALKAAAAAKEIERVKFSSQVYIEALDELEKKLKKGEITSVDYRIQKEELAKQLGLTSKQVRELDSDFAKLDKRTSSGTDQLTTITRRIAQAYVVLLAAEKSFKAAFSGVEEYAKYESAMAGVQKVTGDSATKMQELGTELTRLSTSVTPTAVEGLLDIAQAAAQAGIKGTENLISVTKSMDALSAASDLTARDATEAVTRIARLTGETTESFDAIASAMVGLGNATNTTESAIAHYATRMAAMLSSTDANAAEILGLSAAFAELGQRSELSSSVTSRAMRAIEDAVKGGGKELEAFAKQAGMTADEFKKAYGESQVNLLLDWAKGVGAATNETTSLNMLLDEVNLNGTQNAGIIAAMGANHERFAEDIKTSTEAMKAADEHYKSFAKRTATLEGQFGLLSNKMADMAAVMGQTTAIGLNGVISTTGSSMDKMGSAAVAVGDILDDVIQISMNLTTGLGNLLSSIDNVGNETGLLTTLLAAFENGLDVVASAADAAALAVSGYGLAWSSIVGDDEQYRKWEKTRQDALDNIAKTADRIALRVRVAEGETSKAFEQMREAYENNTDAIALMSKEEQEALEKMIKTTGYVKGFDDVYRNFSTAINKAARENEIYNKIKNDEIGVSEAGIRTLMAQGIEREKAIDILKKQKIEQDALNKSGKDGNEIVDDAARLQKELEEKLKETSDAYKELGVDMDAAFGVMSEAEVKFIESLNVIIKNTDLASISIDSLGDIVKSAQSKLKDPAAFNEARKILLDWTKDNQEASVAVQKAFMDMYEVAEHELNKLGDAIKAATTFEELDSLTAKLTESFEAGEISADFYADKIEEVNDRHYELVDILDDVKDGVDGVKDSTKDAADEMENLGDKAEEAGDKTNKAVANIAGGINAIASRLFSLSKSVQDAFFGALGMGSGAREASNEIERLQSRLDEVKQSAMEASNWGGVWGSFFANIENAANNAEASFLKQKIALEKLLEQYEKGEVSATWLADAVHGLERQFGMLNNADLSRLQSAIDSVKSRSDSLGQSLESTVTNLKKEIANLKGQQDIVEKMQHEERMAELEHQLNVAKMAGDSKLVNLAREALELEKERYKIKVDALKESEKQAEAEVDAAKEAELNKRADDEARAREAINQTYKEQTKTATSDKIVTVKLDFPSGAVYGEFTDSQVDSLIRKLQEVGAVSR